MYWPLVSREGTQPMQSQHKYCPEQCAHECMKLPGTQGRARETVAVRCLTPAASAQASPPRMSPTLLASAAFQRGVHPPAGCLSALNQECSKMINAFKWDQFGFGWQPQKQVTKGGGSCSVHRRSSERGGRVHMLNTARPSNGSNR